MLKMRREGSGLGSVAAVAAVGTAVGYGTIIALDKGTNLLGVAQPGTPTESTCRSARKAFEKSLKKEEDK